MAEPVTKKELKELIASLDNRIEGKVNAGLLKHLSIKWQSLSIIVAIVLAVCAIQIATLFYVNDRTIKASVAEATADLREDISLLNSKIDKLLNGQKTKPVSLGHAERPREALKSRRASYFLKDGSQPITKNRARQGK